MSRCLRHSSRHHLRCNHHSRHSYRRFRNHCLYHHHYNRHRNCRRNRHCHIRHSPHRYPPSRHWHRLRYHPSRRRHSPRTNRCLHHSHRHHYRRCNRHSRHSYHRFRNRCLHHRRCSRHRNYPRNRHHCCRSRHRNCRYYYRSFQFLLASITIQIYFLPLLLQKIIRLIIFSLKDIGSFFHSIQEYNIISIFFRIQGIQKTDAAARLCAAASVFSYSALLFQCGKFRSHDPLVRLDVHKLPLNWQRKIIPEEPLEDFPYKPCP